MTNRQHLQSLNNAQLAKFLFKLEAENCSVCSFDSVDEFCHGSGTCEDGIAKWLGDTYNDKESIWED